MLRSLMLLLVLVYGCSDDDDGAPRVRAGQSIQAAVDVAAPGSTILVDPGVYHESGQAIAITVSKDGIHLVGLSSPGNPVVLEAVAGQETGIWVSPTGTVDTADDEHPPCGANGELVHDFSVEGFTVRGFEDFGVYLACVNGFRLTENISEDNGEYGLFPVRSHNGTVSNNQATGTTRDSALYVGQSDHVTISGNRAHDNLQGLEVENSSDISVIDNELYANTAGMIVDIMPGLQKDDHANILIRHNSVHDNNRPNPGGEGKTDAPPGIGVVVVGGTQVMVRDNTVSNNGFQGILVTSFCTSDPSACGDLDIDPDPQHVSIIDNQVSHNGTNPPDDPILRQFAADLFWDRKGTGNCWSGNTPGATVKILGGTTLPACE